MSEMIAVYGSVNEVSDKIRQMNLGKNLSVSSLLNTLIHSNSFDIGSVLKDDGETNYDICFLKVEDDDDSQKALKEFIKESGLIIASNESDDESENSEKEILDSIEQEIENETPYFRLSEIRTIDTATRINNSLDKSDPIIYRSKGKIVEAMMPNDAEKSIFVITPSDIDSTPIKFCEDSVDKNYDFMISTKLSFDDNSVSIGNGGDYVFASKPSVAYIIESMTSVYVTCITNGDGCLNYSTWLIDPEHGIGAVLLEEVALEKVSSFIKNELELDNMSALNYVQPNDFDVHPYSLMGLEFTKELTKKVLNYLQEEEQ